MIRNILAIVGGLVLVMYVAGSMGIGNFRLVYSANQVECVKK